MAWLFTVTNIQYLIQDVDNREFEEDMYGSSLYFPFSAQFFYKPKGDSWALVGITYSSGWHVPFNNMYLKFFHVFSWVVACFLLPLNIWFYRHTGLLIYLATEGHLVFKVAFFSVHNRVIIPLYTTVQGSISQKLPGLLRARVGMVSLYL